MFPEATPKWVNGREEDQQRKTRASLGLFLLGDSVPVLLEPDTAYVRGSHKAGLFLYV